ncbi:MAG: TIGR04255 family protein [Micavibrio sp.]|nr:TIGR04255 family protein [Micavibrio sp.]
MTKNEKKFPNLSKPPAMEVVLGLSIRNDDSFDVGNLLVKESAFVEHFPVHDDWYELTNTVNTEDASSHTTKIHKGFVYKSKDSEEITQFGSDVLTYNKVGNYSGGDVFFDGFSASWSAYQSCRKEFKVTKLGLRYINVITVPDFNYNYSDYFNAFIHTPENVKRQKKCFYKYLTMLDGGKYAANVIFMLDSVKENREAKFILDIDIVKKDMPASPSIEQIKDFFEEMRYHKNDIFFSTLKDELLEQYK